MKEKVRSFLVLKNALQGTLPQDFPDSFSLVDSGVLDSLGIYDLILFLEGNFGVEIGIEDLSKKNFNSLNAIDQFLNTKLNK